MGTQKEIRQAYPVMTRPVLKLASLLPSPEINGPMI